jgi:hypothetical protein
VKAAEDGDQRTGLALARMALAAVLGLGTAVVALHDWFGLGAGSLDYACEGPLYDAVIIAAGLTCLLRARVAGYERGAWVAIGAGILVWGLSEIYWTAFLLHRESAPYPSLADVGYLAFYPLAGLGLVLLVRARASQLEWRLWMDGAIASLGTAALGTAFVFDFIVSKTEGTPIEVATTLAYPLGDIALVSLVVGVIALTRWRAGHAWTLLLAGLIAIAVADSAYTLATSAGAAEGDWVNPIYLIGATLLGAAAWRSAPQEIESSARFDGWREFMVPALFAGVMIGLFAMQYFSSTSGLSTVLWAATMIAVIVRLAISVRENKDLLRQVRTDPLTGLGSRGAMQVDLETLCEKASAERPLSLLLFDLNGF